MACSWNPVTLGRSGLRVTPLGVAASYGVGARDLARAYERGVNLFYWGSLRSGPFADGLRHLAPRHRQDMAVIIQSYARWPGGLGRSLEKALRTLRMDYADVLLLGWWNQPPPDRMADAAAELRERGLARHIMVSCHHRPSVPMLARDLRFDLVMFRYNAAHPGAEQDIFPLLPADRPGTVAYTATRWGALLNPDHTPPGERTPTATDCYRFVLSHPAVDACFTGPANGAQLDQALAALDQGPLSEQEQAWMRRVGARVHAATAVTSRAMGWADRAINLVSGFGFQSSASADHHAP